MLWMVFVWGFKVWICFFRRAWEAGVVMCVGTWRARLDGMGVGEDWMDCGGDEMKLTGMIVLVGFWCKCEKLDWMLN
ncbi:hypothetical protein V8C43DRAFT_284952 [Trichoderma afarasin]